MAIISTLVAQTTILLPILYFYYSFWLILNTFEIFDFINRFYVKKLHFDLFYIKNYINNFPGYDLELKSAFLFGNR